MTIESAGCKMKFLPAYSPDLNPIEQEWFPIKNKIRQLLDQGEALENAAMKILNEKSKPLC